MITAAGAVPRPGAVSGAVVRAARLSAGLSEALLAKAAGMEEVAIHAWEGGSRSLVSAPYPRMEQLQAALRAAGSDPQIVADLDAAAWCDLVIVALTGNRDATLLLADPVACGGRFHELLAWSLSGSVPDRYGPYMADGPLVDAPSVALTVLVTQLLGLVHRLSGNTVTS